MKLAYARWVDASSDCEEFEVSDDFHVAEIETVGQFVREDDLVLVLCTDRDARETHKLRCRHVIPKGWIRESFTFELPTKGA